MKIYLYKRMFLFICLMIFSLISLSQTKAEAQDWFKFYANKYYSSNFNIYHRDLVREKKPSFKYKFHNYEYEFYKDKFIVKNYTYVDSLYKTFQTSLEYDSIYLKYVIKVEIDSFQIGSVMSTRITLLFKQPDQFSKYIYPIVTYDNFNDKIISTKGSVRIRYELLSEDDDSRENNLPERMKKALELIINQSGGKLIKELF